MPPKPKTGFEYEDYEVESYFINVGVGDGAVHLLRKGGDTVGSVLMDGGRPTARGDLKLAVGKLMKDDASLRRKRFTSIVVTHWDGDHYGGLLALLYHDMVGSPTNAKNWTYVDQNQTTFYCPARSVNKIVQQGWKIDVGGNQCYLMFQDGKKDAWYQACKAVFSTHCLGIDLFTGKHFDNNAGNPPKLKDPVTSLLGYYGKCAELQKQLSPVFPCISVDEKFINEKWRVFEEGWKKKSDDAKDMNASSIMAAVVWPVPSNQSPLRISLYTGGDAEEVLERSFIAWMTNAAPPGVKLDAVKAGHHGSHNATPENLLMFDAQAFIVSAGDEYGHPSFATLFYVLAVAQFKNSLGKAFPQVLGTRAPYWMTAGLDTLRSADLNVSTVLSFKDGTTAILDALKNMSGNDNMFWDIVSKAAAAMKTYYSLSYSKEQFEKLQKDWANTALGRLPSQYWKPPGSNAGTAQAAFEDCTEIARNGVILRWNQFGSPDLADQETASYVHMTATGNSGDVVCRLDYRKGTARATARKTRQKVTTPRTRTRQTLKQYDALVKQYAAAKNPGTNSANLVANKNKVVRSSLRIRKQKKRRGRRVFLMAAQAPTDPLETWTRDLFIDEFQALKGQPPVKLSEENSDVCEWLHKCFTDPDGGASGKVSVEVSYFTSTGAPDGGIGLDQIELTVTFQDAANKPVLAFTTAETSRKSQFGPAAVDGAVKPTLPGYYSSLCGMLFALDPAKSARTLTFGQFAQVMQFPLHKTAAQHLNDLPLKVRAADGARSGLWFIPDGDNRVILRLAMEPALGDSKSPVGELQALLKDGLGPVSFANVVVTGTTVYELLLDTNVQITSALDLEATLMLDDPKDPLHELGASLEGSIRLSLSEHGFELVFKFAKASGDLAKLLKIFLARFFAGHGAADESGSADSAVAKIEDALKTVMPKNNIYIRTVSVVFAGDQNTKPAPVSFTVGLEAGLPVGDNQGPPNAPFWVSLQWSDGVFRLSAELWGKAESFGDTPLDLYPYYDSFVRFDPWTDNSVETISIQKLIGQGSLTLPKGIPDTIEEARMSLAYGDGDGDGDGNMTVGLAARLQCESDPPSAKDQGDVPPLWFDEVQLDLALSYTPGSTLPSAFSVQFNTTIELQLDDEHKDPETDRFACMYARISYETGDGGAHWIVAGDVRNIKVANLFGLFAADGSGHAIQDIMAGLVIERASASYEYDSSGLPSTLGLSGTLLLGPPDKFTKNGDEFVRIDNSTKRLRLALTYTHSSGTDGSWSFGAKLASAAADGGNNKVNVSQLLTGLVDDVGSLPTVAQNLEVSPSELSLDLSCKSVKGVDGQKHAIFAVFIAINTSFVITYAQVRSYGDEAKNPPPLQPPAGYARAGRLLRFSLAGLPAVPKMPVVGSVAPPFDQLGIVWTNREITGPEVDVLNNNVFQGPLRLLVKPNKPDPKTGPAPPVGLAAGVHFQVAALEQGQAQLVLDHVVGGAPSPPPPPPPQGGGTGGGGPQPSPPPQPGPPPQPSQTGGSAKEVGPPADAGTSVAPMAKTAGPLSIRNIGLSISGASLSSVCVSLDASVRLGPVSFELMGLTLTFDLSGVRHPDDFKSLHLEPKLAGMSVAFEKPPARLAGTFASFDHGNSAGFMGAVAVSMTRWSALAMGVYEETKTEPFTKSLFIFGVLQGLIAELGCAEINGLSGGFGYNSRLSLPDVSGVPGFPFIALASDTPSQVDILQRLAQFRDGSNAIVSTVPDEMWFAAGLHLKAFQLVDVKALLAVTLSAEPKFAILAEARAVFPKNLKVDDEKEKADPLAHAFLVVDLAMEAVVDPLHGTVLVLGQLMPPSFVLHPSCQLTGGFALAYFLPGSEHAGDWVCTVGGYHPHYTPPAHYPNPPGGRVAIAWQMDADLHLTGEAYFALTPQAAMGGGRLDVVLDRGWLRAGFSAYADFFMHFHPFAFEADVGIALFASATFRPFFITIHLGPLELSADVALRGPPIRGEAHVHVWRWGVDVVFGPADAHASPALKLDEFLRMVKNVTASVPDAGAAAVPNFVVSVTEGAVTLAGGAGSAASGPTEVLSSLLRFEVVTRVPVRSAVIGDAPEQVINSPGTSQPINVFARPTQNKEPWKTSQLVISLERNGVKEPLVPTPLWKNVPPALWGEYTGNPGDDTADPQKTPLLQHVMGYTISVCPKPPSPDRLPAISIKQFCMLDVDKLGNVPIPHINPVEALADDDRFVLGTPREVRAGMAEAAGELLGKARDGAVQAWTAFKKRSSGGGAAEMASLPIFAKAAPPVGK
ncbi:hypothetical protein B0T26DRAFT_753316 [Lasiosphaeria miniovina]|uniref:DUF6603 domain-containing protein n=1 Tax=Lasiosphaeria miniovina TaxID=1954250 RepID=A0AA40AC74_9PEZI|nr:uncharacterized protein B0T26DRAFT_753316 [Lasiosphaeria miniovina]KAK0713177.1 hypothetical protein B0T26DRAFT_753316 [Lasiosphaeria miniovina]